MIFCYLPSHGTSGGWSQTLKLWITSRLFYATALGLLQGVLKGKYHCTVDLLFEWFGLVCFANKNKNCQLSYN
jgi:hypothetical protein